MVHVLVRHVEGSCRLCILFVEENVVLVLAGGMVVVFSVVLVAVIRLDLYDCGGVDAETIPLFVVCCCDIFHIF